MIAAIAQYLNRLGSISNSRGGPAGWLNQLSQRDGNK